MDKKLLLFIISFCILILYDKANADSNDVEAFKEFHQKYYSLDDTIQNEVECKIKISALDDLEKQLEFIPEGVKVKNESNDFCLNYKRNGRLNFNNLPKIEIEIVKLDPTANRTQLENGIKMVKTGHEAIVNGTMTTLKAIFDEYRTPKDSELNEIEFKIKGKKAVLSLIKNGSHVTSEYQGNKVHTVVDSKGTETISDATFTSIENKLAFSSSIDEVNQGISSYEVSTNVEFQKLENVSFPHTITANVNSVSGSTSTKSRITITLDRCVLK